MSQNEKRPRLFAVLLIDLAVALLLCGLLAGYFVFFPHRAVGEELPVSGEERLFDLPVPDGSSDALSALVLSGKTGNASREVLKVFSDAEKQVVLLKNETGSGNSKITWFSADIYVKSVKVLRANVSADETGMIANRSVKSQSKAVNALLAVTGDTFGASKDGVIVRNGVLYRDDVRTFNDVCALCLDGSMKIFKRTSLYSMEEIKKAGAWQVFTFGPSLLDKNGDPNKTFNIAASHLSDLSFEHPRTAVGMVAPGHYVFILVDGRDPGYSKGATFPELARIMVDEGCSVAYNLDGGRSSVMTFNGAVVNSPYKDGRGVSDILYIPLDPVLTSTEGDRYE